PCTRIRSAGSGPPSATTSIRTLFRTRNAATSKASNRFMARLQGGCPIIAQRVSDATLIRIDAWRGRCTIGASTSSALVGEVTTHDPEPIAALVVPDGRGAGGDAGAGPGQAGQERRAIQIRAAPQAGRR